MDPFVGEIRMFAGNFPPRYWALCEGQLLAIASNQALFAILGTTYGGNGVNNFALPDLRGRGPVHFGQGPGLSYHQLGEKFGVEQVTVGISQLPLHTHLMTVSNASADSGDPNLHLLGAPGRETALYSAASATGTMHGSMIRPAGSGVPVPIRPPFLGISFIISLQGEFPTRP